MAIDAATLLAIAAMALATMTTRLGALVLHRFVTLSPERRRILDAIPPAVLAAVVAPTAFATGAAETIACLVTAVAARRLPFLGALVAGVVSVALLRLCGL